jgi:DNA-binding CsgD family transcriptional regulator
MDPLQSLGVSAGAERIYLDLVENGPSPPDGLAGRLGIPEAGLEQPLAELRALGLVARDGDRLTPCPPQLAMESLAQEHSRKAAAAWESAAALARLWQRGAGRQSYIEMLPSYAAAQDVLDRAQTDARERVRAMTVGVLSSPRQRIVGGLFEALARGVDYQVIYGTQVLQDPTGLRMVQECVDAGEEARVVPHVPLNLTVIDDRWALVAARAPVAGQESIAAVVVHHSPFLAGLTGIFEAFWRMAVPITSGQEAAEASDAPSQETKRLLSYLSAGLTDESIAREFGVSERTIARRINRLQELLGAQTRFQLGVQASRQGWL